MPKTIPHQGGNHLATYGYDPTNGKGQIGTVSWGPTPTQNKDTFTYDTLGRLTKQTRLIDNRSYAMETTSFDPLHRPLTVKYPTNEIVTLTYDREGEQTLQAGADTLVGNVTYTGRGQLVLFDRGGSAPDSTFPLLWAGLPLALWQASPLDTFLVCLRVEANDCGGWLCTTVK